MKYLTREEARILDTAASYEYEYTKLSGLLLAASNNVDFDTLRSGVQWVASLHDVVSKLPEGLDVYVGTPLTPYTDMRKAAVDEGRTDCFGLTLPATLQPRISGLFGLGYAGVRETAKTYSLHHCDDTMERFGIPYALEPEEAKPGFLHCHQVSFTTDKINRRHIKTVEVVRSKIDQQTNERVWLGTYKFVTQVRN
jgi:hypothetical protein